MSAEKGTAEGLAGRFPATDPALAAVIFSGGGFRATLFHLGVLLRLLEQRQLDRTTQVYGVSGGAILAAHLGSHWDRYCGSDREACFKSLLTLVRADLRNRVFRRWLLFYILVASVGASCAIAVLLNWGAPAATRWSIAWLVLAASCVVTLALSLLLRLVSPALTRLLEAQYRNFLFTSRTGWTTRALTLQHLEPGVYVTSTSLTTGQLVSFSKNCISIYDNEHTHPQKANKPDYSLARAVCCSSAFPPAFPPVALTKAEMGSPQEGHDHALTDGGVHDNLGVQLFQETAARTSSTRMQVLLSDAGRPLGYSSDMFQPVLRRNLRANDLLMYRVAEYDLDSVQRKLGERLKLTSCRIYPLENRHPFLDDGIQLKIGQIRTDLDTFSRDETFMLVKHGYHSCSHALGEAADPPATSQVDAQILGLCGLNVNPDSLRDKFNRRYKQPTKFRRILVWMFQLRRLAIGVDRAAFLWLLPLACLLLAGLTYWDRTRAIPPQSMTWDDGGQGSDDIILASLLKELAERSNPDTALGSTVQLCVLVSQPFGHLVGGHVPARFGIEVPYKNLMATGGQDVHNCWLFVRSLVSAGASGEGGRYTYRAVGERSLDDAFLFQIDSPSSSDTVVLVAPRLSDAHCKALRQAIIVKGR